MKIPALLMTSLLTVSLSAQATKPVTKKTKKLPVKKERKIYSPQKAQQPVAKKDTVLSKTSGYCPACGMG